jgi:hypothetical protein
LYLTGGATTTTDHQGKHYLLLIFFVNYREIRKDQRFQKCSNIGYIIIKKCSLKKLRVQIRKRKFSFSSLHYLHYLFAKFYLSKKMLKNEISVQI